MSEFYPAMAIAIKVFPDPGGPEISIPLGGDTPSQLNIVECFIGHSIISFSYFTISFIPPTSLNVIFEYTLCFSKISSI